MFKTGDKAILKISFEMVERGGDYTFDDHEDVERHVRGDMVEILRVIDNKTDKRKHDKLAVIYNPKTFASTTVAINHLEPIKGEININVPVKIEVDAKKIADALTNMNEAIKKGVKVNVGDPKKIEKGTLGSYDMKATGVRTYLKIHRYTLAECCDQITK
ncbi:hypothetical protein AT278_14365 [Bacillus cereus]|uniref:hypothetical protein n=2 Tax=Bacillaceae TaxID=186817 RepID=UPI00077A8538|nr:MULTISPECIES: hypothetical protein [Bacillus]KAB7675497.1 hypothetical protein GBN91_27430 [Bacillus sp. B1-WWTP-T-0.5-Post-4]KXY57156.1 hypothetical protein AT278_14365 [Bacillus cereus]PGM73072.1 hypothetical protein CN952_10940 [Bacillus cereus]PGN06915.1 hypothetical protein CN954_23850 [Bacillus cereus]